LMAYLGERRGEKDPVEPKGDHIDDD
jgi:hypothetical protein